VMRRKRLKFGSGRTNEVGKEEHVEENALSAKNNETEEGGRVADLHEGEEVLRVSC
jgi:hypothetical protein